MSALIGKKLQERRIEKGFVSQQDLADAINVDQARISRWEGGKSLPNSRYKNKLTEVLGLEPGFFDHETKRAKPEIEELRARLEKLEKQIKPTGAKADLITIINSLDESQIIALTGVVKKWLSLRNTAVKKDEIGS